MALGDMFLKVVTAKGGVVKGEAVDALHGGEIDVVGWNWGLRQHTDMSTGGPSSKRTLDQLEITKKVDKASLVLMQAVSTNDEVKKATLTVRKAGKDPLEYFVITLEEARVTSVQAWSEAPELREKVTLSFRKISIEYKPQANEGTASGGVLFNDEVGTGG
ncbi:MAG: Hcp1 family type secretion system effector [Betaproteobacteria bacterium]|jgi:type VI secretion system secreted protein Hcp|nr:Hcp1 family type secretion system effector [Betaproteobacteria bacterium]